MTDSDDTSNELNSTSDNAAATDSAPGGGIAKVRTVELRAPLAWLVRGWQDLVATRFRGVLYGAVFVAMGYLVVWQYATKWQFTMGLISGFFLMGPFICTGVYELSRQLHRNEKVSLIGSLTCWRRNLGSIAFFAIMLTFAMIVWARVSVIMFALTSTTSFPTLQGVLSMIFSLDNPQFLLVWTGVGFVFASLVFAISVVSVPMMLDRGSDTLMAVFSSARTLLANPKPLYLWALLVVVIIGFSLALGFIPLLLTAPLVGHATWHAYQDLLEPTQN